MFVSCTIKQAISVSASGGAVQCSATQLYTAYKVIVSRFFLLISIKRSDQTQRIAAHVCKIMEN